MIKRSVKYLVFVLVAAGLVYGGYQIMNTPANSKKTPTEKVEKEEHAEGGVEMSDAKVAAVDDTVLRATFTANSSDSSFTIGTMPNTSGRTYIGSKLTLKVSTAFSGGSVDGIVVNDGTNDLMAVAQNDPTVTGLYIVDLGAEAIAGGATVTASFKQSNGSTAATPTAGVVTATVEYQFLT